MVYVYIIQFIKRDEMMQSTNKNILAAPSRLLPIDSPALQLVLGVQLFQYVLRALFAVGCDVNNGVGRFS